MKIIDIIILVAYLCGIMFLGSFIGKKNKKGSGEEYLSGGRSMPWYAIGLSVGLTMISANTFIGGPGWAYNDGIVAAMVNISVPLSIFFITYTILPIVYSTKVVTVYEYVNLRFGTKTRILNVIAWLIQSLIFVGGFVYTPSLVLEAITGVSMKIWVPLLIIMTTFYAVAGGIKAAIWADMIQGIILFTGLVLGIIVASSGLDMTLGAAIDVARQVGLTQSFDFSFSGSKLTIWCALIGGFCMWAGYFGYDQGQVQRYITAKDVRTIKKTGIMSSIGMQSIYWLCFFLGIILYVFYLTNAHTLDFANTNNVMIDFLINYCPHGLLGILLAAMFSAAMSSIAAVINSMSAVFIRDIYEPYISKKPNTPLSKSILFSSISGIVVIIFVYLYLGDSTASILLTIGKYTAPTASTLTGIMLCSLFIPCTNDNGCFFGSILAVISSMFIGSMLPDLYYLWSYAYTTLLCIVFSYLLSKLMPNADESKRAFPYTLKGARIALKGKTDETGCSIEPLNFDKYGYITLGVLVVQIIILALLQ